MWVLRENCRERNSRGGRETTFPDDHPWKHENMEKTCNWTFDRSKPCASLVASLSLESCGCGYGVESTTPRLGTITCIKSKNIITKPMSDWVGKSINAPKQFMESTHHINCKQHESTNFPKEQMRPESMPPWMITLVPKLDVPTTNIPNTNSNWQSHQVYHIMMKITGHRFSSI